MAKKLLIAEDEIHISKLIEFKMSRSGFDVTVAGNGQEAEDRLPDENWDLIVLDVMMPFKDGWQVLATIRKSDRYKNIPVLMLTAKGHQNDIDAATELGATRYLTKPFDPDELAKVVGELTQSGDDKS